MIFDKDDIEDIILPSNISYTVDRFRCQAKVYAPRIFTHLREMLDVTDDMVSQSFDIITNLPLLKSNSGNEGGKSASFFYFSFDKKFIIKTISRGEKRFFLKEVLPNFHRHLMDHKDSILSRIIGVFTFKFEDNTKSRVILQSNIFPTVQLVGIFDLKGSKLDRSSAKSSEGAITIKSNKIYKDLDFLNVIKKIQLEEVDVQRLKISIFKDSGFLSKYNIIDYSLLLGISHEYNSDFKPLIGTGKDKGYYYYVGIIDYLQTYNTFKQLEAFSKNLLLINVPKEDISVISAGQYCDRFTSFICSIICN